MTPPNPEWSGKTAALHVGFAASTPSDAPGNPGSHSMGEFIPNPGYAAGYLRTSLANSPALLSSARGLFGRVA